MSRDSAMPTILNMPNKQWLYDCMIIVIRFQLTIKYLCMLTCYSNDGSVAQWITPILLSCTCNAACTVRKVFEAEACFIQIKVDHQYVREQFKGREKHGVYTTVPSSVVHLGNCIGGCWRVCARKKFKTTPILSATPTNFKQSRPFWGVHY